MSWFCYAGGNAFREKLDAPFISPVGAVPFLIASAVCCVLTVALYLFSFILIYCFVLGRTLDPSDVPQRPGSLRATAEEVLVLLTHPEMVKTGHL